MPMPRPWRLAMWYGSSLDGGGVDGGNTSASTTVVRGGRTVMMMENPPGLQTATVGLFKLSFHTEASDGVMEK